MSSLQESRNEWCVRLINILTPLVTEGFKSIFDEAYKLCVENDELEKYLMTYQNFLARIPKWNPTIIEEETKRIVEKSNCGYLNDLISCVHIIQLKSLTCMRVGNKQKKIDIDIPSLNNFVHKVYINGARKLYTNIYLFEKNVPPLQIQKHNREIEFILKESILNAIRDNIPVENILSVYLDETIEEDVQIEEKEEIISTEPIVEENEENDENDENDENEENDQNKSDTSNINISQQNLSEIVENIKEQTNQSLNFSDVDQTITTDNVVNNVDAPKTNERLEQISIERNDYRKSLEEDDNDDKIKIGEKIQLTDLDVHNLDPASTKINTHSILDEIEILT